MRSLLADSRCEIFGRVDTTLETKFACDELLIPIDLYLATYRIEFIEYSNYVMVSHRASWARRRGTHEFGHELNGSCCLVSFGSRTHGRGLINL